MAWTPVSDEDLDPQPDTPAKIVRLPARKVIIENRLVSAAKLPARRFGSLQRLWRLTPTIVKKDVAALTALIGSAAVVSTSFSPFFVFGLALVMRLFFFLFYSLRIEIGRFEAKVAARSLAYLNAVAFVAITVVLVTSSAMWKYQAYTYLAIALVMEVVSVATWYTKWAAMSELDNNGNGGLNRVFEPKKAYLFLAFAFLLAEYVAYGIEWCPLLDEILLWLYHAAIWIYHLVIDVFHVLVFLVEHPILALIVIIALAVVKIKFL